MNYSRKVSCGPGKDMRSGANGLTSEEFRRDYIVHNFLFSRPVRVFFIALDNDPELW